MRQTVTKIRGLTVNVEVVETCQTDQNGDILCYIAAIYVQAHGSADKVLIRKSRLPGTAKDLQRELQERGLRAVDKLTDIARHRYFK